MVHWLMSMPAPWLDPQSLKHNLIPPSWARCWIRNRICSAKRAPPLFLWMVTVLALYVCKLSRLHTRWSELRGLVAVCVWSRDWEVRHIPCIKFVMRLVLMLPDHIQKHVDCLSQTCIMAKIMNPSHHYCHWNRVSWILAWPSSTSILVDTRC